MYIERNIHHELHRWRTNPRRKPLVVRGARQVGKTTAIVEFGKSYNHFIHLNLEKVNDLRYFDRFNEVKEIVDALLLANNITSDQVTSTLLFIDEIQASPKAIAMLRYFYEEIPELHMIAAGSLLEFVLSEVNSFPVGRVQYLYVSPLNFDEYLGARKLTAAQSALRQIPYPKAAYTTLMDQFNRFAIIGGMPEVIAQFVETDSLADLTATYQSIWSAYKDDVEKYGSGTTQKNVIRHILQSAPSQLDNRIKFQNFGNSNYRSREVGEAMRALDQAKVLRLIYPTTDTVPPIRPDYKKSPRLQFLDTGIVNHELNIQADLLGVDDLSSSFKGALIPHLITQELLSLSTGANQTPNFWVRDKTQSSAEVDLVLAHQGSVIPIEIKSGKKGTLKSLHQFIDAVDHQLAIRIYGNEFVIEQTKTASGKPFTLMNIPYFLGSKLPEYVAYLVENHG